MDAKDPPPGGDRSGETLLGKWHLSRLLGVGGMASVYAATHRNGSRGAVKLLHPELGAQKDTRERFLREGLLANRVEHPGVVRVLDDDVDEKGNAFLVMELLTGESVEARASKAPGERLSEREVRMIALSLAETMAAAHAKGIVHRDLKPENLFLTEDGKLKVLDFGIARLGLTRDSVRATQAGALMGTPAFMAPEQALGHVDKMGPTTDVWSIGATMFTLLTGELVHQATTTQELLLAAMTKQAPPTRERAPHLSPQLAHIIDVALAKEQARRYADAGVMLDALRGLGAEASNDTLLDVGSAPRARLDRDTALAQSINTPSAQPPPRTTRFVLLAAGLGVVLGGALFVRARLDSTSGTAHQTPSEAEVSASAEATPTQAPVPGPGVSVIAPTVTTATTAASAVPGLSASAATPSAVVASPRVPATTVPTAPALTASPALSAPTTTPTAQPAFTGRF